MNNYYQSYQAFKRPFIRDLAFAIACPNVITNWQSVMKSHAGEDNPQPICVHSPTFWQTQFNNYQPRLSELDSTPQYQKLTTFLLNRPSPHRLGFHFEGLMLFWLQDGFAQGIHPFEVIAHNVQIVEDNKRNKVTLGELDIIIRNHESNEIEQWELAIKFYLGSAPFEPINWVGINSKDNLQRKLDHMASKPFSHHHISIANQEVSIDKRYAVIKGRFFAPFTANENSFFYPDWLTDAFPLHTWYTLEQAKNQFTDNTIRKSHYVEWFTEREFYQDKDSLQVELQRNAGNFIQTGLYFLHQNGQKTIQKSTMTIQSTPSYFVIKSL